MSQKGQDQTSPWCWCKEHPVRILKGFIYTVKSYNADKVCGWTDGQTISWLAGWKKVQTNEPMDRWSPNYDPPMNSVGNNNINDNSQVFKFPVLFLVTSWWPSADTFTLGRVCRHIQNQIILYILYHIVTDHPLLASFITIIHPQNNFWFPLPIMKIWNTQIK